MNPPDVVAILERLVPRDLEILESLRAHRMASTTQLRVLHFAEPFASEVAATRVTIRVLNRLEAHRLITRLERRIGGVRKGSASLVWQLAATGERLLATMHGDKRRRYLEPGGAFVRHTLAVTELAVQLNQAHRQGHFEHVHLVPEPGNWRRFMGAHGRPEILKPDLTAITAAGDYEDHWFLERDLGTEHPPVVARKALVYERYAQTGLAQADQGVLPAVLWVVSTRARQIALERALRRTRGLTPGVHRVITEVEFLPTVLAGSDPPAGP